MKRAKASVSMFAPICLARQEMLRLGVIAAWWLAGSLDAADSVPLRTGPHRDVTIQAIETGVSEIATTGSVPHFWTVPVAADFEPDRHTVIAFEYFSLSGIESLHLRYRQSDGSMTYAGEAALPVAETWQPFSMDFTEIRPPAPKGDPEFRFHFALPSQPASSLRIRNFVVRIPNPTEIAAKMKQDEVRKLREADAEAALSHLRADFPSEIREVTVAQGTVRVSGRTGDGLMLRELLLHEPSHCVNSAGGVVEVPKGEFALELPRFVEGRDRALSRWRLESADGAPASRARWYDATAPGVAGSLPKFSAPHQKGLGGIPPDSTTGSYSF